MEVRGRAESQPLGSGRGVVEVVTMEVFSDRVFGAEGTAGAAGGAGRGALDRLIDPDLCLDDIVEIWKGEAGGGECVEIRRSR